MYLLYDLILLLAALLLIPWYLLRGFLHGKVRRGIRERLGLYESGRLSSLQGRRTIWVHAVSVGETRAAIPLLRALKTAYPQHALVLSNVTETGHAIGKGIREVDLCLFFPFDLSRVVRRVLRLVRPAMVIIVETEIWPNFVRIARGSGIPVVLVNGRISDRSFPRYRMARLLLKPVLEQFSAFCMQTEQDARRISDMGAPPDRVQVTRNLKFDMQAAVPDAAATGVLRHDFRLPPQVLVLVAGSTHAGEEETVVSVYRRMLEEGRRVLLVLVPRHPERCRNVGEMLSSNGFSFVLRSAVEGLDRQLDCGEVLLVDTVGEMLKFYAMADVVFVGGSLVAVGGHNVLEASLLKKPVVFGHYMHNFKEISSLLLDAGGGLQVTGDEDLAAAVRRLLDDETLRREMGERGFALLQANVGATEQTLQTIRSLLVP